MSIVNPNTFRPTAEVEVCSFGTIVDGEVEVTLRGETRIVRANRWSYNDGRVDVVAYGMSGRYVTGAKAWPASVRHSTQTGAEQISFGRDDRAAKFNKANCLSFRD